MVMKRFRPSFFLSWLSFFFFFWFPTKVGKGPARAAAERNRPVRVRQCAASEQLLCCTGGTSRGRLRIVFISHLASTALAGCPKVYFLFCLFLLYLRHRC